MLGLLKKRSGKQSAMTMDSSSIEVTCPGCSISYEIERFQDEAIQCMDCGKVYLQKTNSNKVIDWIREKIKTVGAC